MKKFIPHTLLLLSVSACSICSGQNAGQLTNAERLFLGDNAARYQSAYRQTGQTHRHVRSANKYSSEAYLRPNRFQTASRATTTERIADIDLVLPKLQGGAITPGVDSSLFGQTTAVKNFANAKGAATNGPVKPMVLKTMPTKVKSAGEHSLTMTKLLDPTDLIKLAKPKN